VASAAIVGWASVVELLVRALSWRLDLQWVVCTRWNMGRSVVAGNLKEVGGAVKEGVLC
jgi:hypothetical protein